MKREAWFDIKDNRVCLHGTLDYDHIMGLYKDLLNVLENQQTWRFSFGNIAVSTEALLLLVQLLKAAKASKVTVIFEEVPQQILLMAKAARVEHLIAAHIKDC